MIKLLAILILLITETGCTKIEEKFNNTKSEQRRIDFAERFPIPSLVEEKFNNIKHEQRRVDFAERFSIPASYFCDYTTPSDWKQFCIPCITEKEKRNMCFYRKDNQCSGYKILSKRIVIDKKTGGKWYICEKEMSGNWSFSFYPKY